MKNLEIITLEYKDIAVTIKIDYMKHNVSLVEPHNFAKNNYAVKQWVFAERGVEYEKGWFNILDAMKYAIGYGMKLLKEDAEKFLDEKVKDFLEVKK
jgi:hypothetical protein